MIVGGSDGIGAQLARDFAADGSLVAVIGRSQAKLDSLVASQANIKAYRHEVRDLADAPALFQTILEDLGGCDVFVYCAGVMPLGPSDEFDFAKDEQTIAVNLNAAILWIGMAADRFNQLRSGIIVGIGSVAGVRGRAGMPAYAASKAGLHTYLEALRNRLWKNGVIVTTVKPGPVDTELTAQLQYKKMAVSEASKRIRKLMESGGERYLLPAHAVIFTILKSLPSAIFRRLKI